MLTVREALDRVLAETQRLPVQEVPVGEGVGRILAEDVVATRDVPAWDNSAMDGYAVRAADTASGEAALRVLEVIGAGSVPTQRVEAGTASAIMTGAPVPEGADAIVMVEDSDGSQQGEVHLLGVAEPGQHIRRRGEDIRAGTTLLEAGTRLGPAGLGHAASQGVARLVVSRRPVVAILSTGDEVVPPGEPIGPGQLFSSNNASLAGLVVQAGGIPRDFGTAPDDLGAIRDRLAACIAEADCVLTTGGVSVGEFDFVKDAFEQVGVPMGFWRVSMKPGKPLAFGVAQRGDTKVPVFGLPGNPVSCMVNFLQFVRPRLLTAMGASHPYLPVLHARAGEDLRIRPGRLSFVRVALERRGEQIFARFTGNQSSGVLTSMVRAHGLAILDGDGAREGDLVQVQLLDPDFLAGTDPGWA